MLPWTTTNGETLGSIKAAPTRRLLAISLQISDGHSVTGNLLCHSTKHAILELADPVPLLWVWALASISLSRLLPI